MLKLLKVHPWDLTTLLAEIVMDIDCVVYPPQSKLTLKVSVVSGSPKMPILMLGPSIVPCHTALTAIFLLGLPEVFITLEFDGTWDGALDATRKGIFQTAANRLGCYHC